MKAEEIFRDLNDKYGDDFNRHMLSPANKTFVAELKREIGINHFLYRTQICAIAKCDSNDDVLYVSKNKTGRDIYYIFHLTYSAHNADGFPKYKSFESIDSVKDFIEQPFLIKDL